MREPNLVEVDVDTITVTDQAILVSDSKVECWLPKSLIEDYKGNEDSPTTILIPEWLAIREGFV